MTPFIMFSVMFLVFMQLYSECHSCQWRVCVRARVRVFSGFGKKMYTQ